MNFEFRKSGIYSYLDISIFRYYPGCTGKRVKLKGVKKAVFRRFQCSQILGPRSLRGLGSGTPR